MTLLWGIAKKQRSIAALSLALSAFMASAQIPHPSESAASAVPKAPVESIAKTHLLPENLVEKAAQEQKAIMLVFTQENCEYCEALKKEIIEPLLATERDSRIITLIAHRQYRNPLPDDQQVRALVDHYDVYVYPTVVLIDAMGNEVAERQVGYQSEDDFYWAYLDKSIRATQRQLAN